MATYSTNLGITLPDDGEFAGTWGQYTNTNLGTLIEQAVSGYVTQAMNASTDVTIDIPNGSTGVARNMYIECTGSMSQANNLIVPAKRKLYFIYNNTSGGFAVTLKTTSGTGIAVPPGKKMVLACDGTNIVDALSSISSLNISGLTASTNLALDASKNVVSVTNTGTGNNVLATSPVLTTPNIGTPSAGTLTNCTGLPFAGTTGTLAADRGGTGQSSYAVGDLLYASTTTALSKLADVATGNALISGGVGVAPSWGKVGLTTHISGTLPIANGGTGSTSTTYCSLTTNVTGTLPLTNGGTGATTQAGAANAVLPSQSTNNGKYLTTDGTNVSWATVTAGVGTVTSVSGTGTVSGVTLTGTVTSSGSLTLGGTLAVTASNFASQTANTFLSAPNGSAGVPTFRAIVAADVPTLNQNTTGTAANVTGTVAVANGGTGATSAATARSNLSAAASGANTDITALDQDVTVTATGTITADTIGYRGLPQNSKTANYTLATGDQGKHISITTGGINVPISVFAAGEAVTIFNNSGTSQTITQNASVTLRQAGTANTGNRTLAQYGICTILCITGGATPTFVISGAGLS